MLCKVLLNGLDDLTILDDIDKQQRICDLEFQQVEQVASPVRWDASVSAMAAAGVDTFVEIGPGTTLSGLIRKTVPSARVANVNDPSSLQATVRLLQPVVQGTGNG